MPIRQLLFIILSCSVLFLGCKSKSENSTGLFGLVQKDEGMTLLARYGKTTDEFDDFINRIKEEHNLMDHKIEVFLGPYFYTNWLIAAMYTDRFNPTHHYLLMENEVYDVLTIDERYCVIAHEVGHLVIENSLPRRYKYPFNIYVSYEIKADNFAVSYMGTDIMESTLKKIFNYKPNYRARMLNVNMLKLQGK